MLLRYMVVVGKLVISKLGSNLVWVYEIYLVMHVSCNVNVFATESNSCSQF